MTALSPGCRAERALRRLVTALALAALALLGLTAPAVAADYDDAVDPSSITIGPCPEGALSRCAEGAAPTSGPVQQWSALRVDMGWKVPDGAKAGDTFTVKLGPPFSAYGGSFDLKTSDGRTAGTCTGLAGGDTSTVTCTFSDYVTGLHDVHGTLWFAVQAAKASDATTTTVDLGSQTTRVTVPSVTGVGDPAGGDSRKNGWVDYPRQGRTDARITWNVLIDSTDLTAGGSTTLTDTLSGSQGFVEDKLALSILYVEIGQDYSQASVLDPASTTPTLSDSRGDGRGSRTLSLTLPDLHATGQVPEGTAYQYRVRYRSVPDDADAVVPDTRFTNQVTAGNLKTTSSVTYRSIGGGTADGEKTGGLTVAKKVTDADGKTIPAAADQRYTVTATYTDAAGTQVSKDIELTPGGEPQGLADLPAGTVVTLTEKTDVPTLEGYTPTSHAFTAETLNDAIQISDDGATATVTIRPGTLRLALTNVYTPVPPTTTPPTTTPPTTTPPTTTPPTTTPPATTPPTTPPPATTPPVETTPPAECVTPTPSTEGGNVTPSGPDSTTPSGPSPSTCPTGGSTAPVTCAGGSSGSGSSTPGTSSTTPTSCTGAVQTASSAGRAPAAAHGTRSSVAPAAQRSGVTRLPRTGAEVAATAGIGVAAIALGAGLVLWSRRRRIARTER